MKIRIKLWMRMLVLIVVVLALSFLASYVIISGNYKKVAFHETFESNNHHAYQYAAVVKTELDNSFQELLSLSQVVGIGSNLSFEESQQLTKTIFENVLKENPKYVKIWTSHQLKFIDEYWSQDNGRIKSSYTLTDGYLNIERDSLDLFAEDFESLNSYVKLLPEPTIMNPVWYTPNSNSLDKELKSSLIVPFFNGEEFAGIVGVELSLINVTTKLDTLAKEASFDLKLFSFNGDIIISPNKKELGKNIIEVDTVLARSFSILDRIQSGENSNFSLKGYSGADSVTFSVSSFSISECTTPWCILISSPLESVKDEIDEMLSITKTAGKVGLSIIVIVIFMFALSLTGVLKKTIELINMLARGDISHAEKIRISTSDETKDMAESANRLVDGLYEVTGFAQSIGKGDFDYQFEKKNENDMLGAAILNMRDSLADARKESDQRRKKEEELNWASQGLNVFNRVLRVDNQSLDELSYNIIETLTTYLNTHMGGVYVKSSDKNDNYELVAHIGFGKEKFNNKIVEPGDGIVGRCILEKETIFINDVPDDFAKVKSGLGNSIPRSILVVPLFSNLKMIGVLEIESLKEIKPYQISFVEKLAESIGSTIATVKINVRTTQLLNRSQKQAEELEQQEEEMRQNMEEMQATQEEAAKRELELEKLIQGFKQVLLIAEYDTNGKLKDLNDNYQQILRAPKAQLVGKLHKSDVFLEESEQETQKQFWNDLRRGEMKVSTEYYKTNKADYWVEEYFLPVKTSHGIVTQVMCIGIDITDQKKIESELKRVKEGVGTGDGRTGNVKPEGKKIDLSLKLEVIDLTYLRMLYKSDAKKIYNIIKLYNDTLPPQILELEDINKARDFKRLKSRTKGLKTKMSYLGLKVIYEEFRTIEKLIDSEKNLNKISGILDKIKNRWALASKELDKLLG